MAKHLPSFAVPIDKIWTLIPHVYFFVMKTYVNIILTCYNLFTSSIFRNKHLHYLLYGCCSQILLSFVLMVV